MPVPWCVPRPNDAAKLEPMKSPALPSKTSLLTAGLALLLAGCAALPSSTPPATAWPAQWANPRPHGGQTVALVDWWSGFDDPLVPQLVQRAEQSHAGLAQATARIAQARAAATAAGASRWPSLQGSASAVRSHTSLPPSAGTATSGNAGLDALWEIDLFGGQAQGRNAAEARLQGAQDQWHEARVSLAAEVGATYASLRACEASLELARQSAASLAQSADLLDRKARAGFEAPANAALAQAAAAEARQRSTAQEAECEVTTQGLVALTQMPLAELKQALVDRRGLLPRPKLFEVRGLPAEVLDQRPDLAAAARQVAAAAADVGVAEADRWPRLSLAGSLGYGELRSGGASFDGSTWSLGANLLAPLIDGGRRKAASEAARARHDEAVAVWLGQARQAVREVEEALIRLDANARQEADAQGAAQGYETFLKSAQTQWRAGTGSLLDLETARRNQLAAQNTLIQVRRDHLLAWVALYKAVGGGWTPASAPPPDASPSTTPAVRS